ncbi:STAS domain-containing protein [Kitasatospora sp. NBC_00315]|uniref:STAS domain-containing protein n=1 Tax=Kitasatospora sp. NBC_00315 TaxID=2975963 RepID=UPI00324750ED
MAAPAHVDPPALSVRLRPGSGDPVLAATADLDQDTGPILDAALDRLLAAVPEPEPGELVLDMSRVRFCDSGGLNALLRARLRVEEAGGVLHVPAPTARVVAPFERTGVDQVLRISPATAPPDPAGQAHPSS